MPAVALTIAGSDPSGGAGIQADLKTFQAFGVYGEAVITLITVQNTVSVDRVEVLSADLVNAQLQAVLSDIPPNAAKTGALGSVEVVETIARCAESFRFPLVVDPVMISKHGGRLISKEAEEVLRKKLIPRAYLLTPNLPEAEILARCEIRSEADFEDACARILDLGCQSVLLKGGHKEGEPADILRTRSAMQVFHGTRVHSHHTHGTGCTLSAAITAGLARGLDLAKSIHQAKRFVQAAIEQAPGLGRGHGPLNHMLDNVLYLEQ